MTRNHEVQPRLRKANSASLREEPSANVNKRHKDDGKSKAYFLWGLAPIYGSTQAAACVALVEHVSKFVVHALLSASPAGLREAREILELTDGWDLAAVFFKRVQ